MCVPENNDNVNTGTSNQYISDQEEKDMLKLFPFPTNICSFEI